MNKKNKMKGNQFIPVTSGVFIISLFLYALSMALPAAQITTTQGVDNIYGGEAYLLSYLSFLASGSDAILIILGFLSNFFILIIIINSIIAKFRDKNTMPIDDLPKMIYPWVSLLSILSVLVWNFQDFVITFYIGYYIWAISSIGIVVSFSVLKVGNHPKEMND